MSQPEHEQEPSSDSSVSRKRSGTRRIDGPAASEPVVVPPAPKLPSLGWVPGSEQDHIPTQPEHDAPSNHGETVPAPQRQSTLDVVMPDDDDDDDRDTIPSPPPPRD
ncbi:MAG: hypothetical protein IPI67_34910 [Myxococcales bacterium]|nr:hypothetical protein [Myxococcales bacterium]